MLTKIKNLFSSFSGGAGINLKYINCVNCGKEIVAEDGEFACKDCEYLVDSYGNKNCARCNNTFEKGYVSIFKNNKLLESICRSCNDIELLDRWKEKGIISSSLMRKAVLEQFYDSNDEYKTIYKSIQEIQDKANEFEEQTWLPKLKKQVDDERKYSGMSANVDGISVMTYVCAGRCMITIENDKSTVTLLTHQDYPESYKKYNFDPPKHCMGLHGIFATKEDAIELIDLVMNSDITLKVNKSVSMI